MVKVPTYNRQVSPDLATVPNAPAVPHLDLSGALSGINRVGEANQNLAKVEGAIGEELAKHAIEQQRLQYEAKNSQLDTSYRQGIENLLDDPTPETIKVNGQDVTRPRGILQRQLGQVDGSLEEFDSKGAKLYNDYLSQVKDPTYRAKLAKQLGDYSISKRDDVVRHQVKQSREDTKNKFQSNIDKQISDAAVIQNPKELGEAIDTVTLTQHNLNTFQALDPETSNLNIQKSISKVVDGSVTNSLITTGDLTRAQGLLDSVKDKIGVDSYNDISKKLNTGFRNIKQLASAKQREGEIVNRYNMITDALGGKINWSNANQVMGGLDSKDPQLVQAVGKLVNQGGRYLPDSTDDLAYMNTAKTMINMNDQQKISDFLLSSLAADGGRRSPNKLAILLSVAKQRHDELNQPAQQKSNGILKSAIDFFEKSNGMLAPTMFMNFAQSLFSGKQGKTIDQLKQEAARKAIVQEHPEVAGLQAIPNKIGKPGQSVNTVYTGLTPIQGYDDGDASDQSSSD